MFINTNVAINTMEITSDIIETKYNLLTLLIVITILLHCRSLGIICLLSKEKILILLRTDLSLTPRGKTLFGGSDESRTRYLLHAMEALYQVSYGPDCLIIIRKNRNDFNTFIKKDNHAVALFSFNSFYFWFFLFAINPNIPPTIPNAESSIADMIIIASNIPLE